MTEKPSTKAREALETIASLALIPGTVSEKTERMVENNESIVSDALDELDRLAPEVVSMASSIMALELGRKDAEILANAKNSLKNVERVSDKLEDARREIARKDAEIARLKEDYHELGEAIRTGLSRQKP